MDNADRPVAGSGLTVVFVGPLLACFEQLAAAARRRGVRTVWIGYPYSTLRRARSRMFVNRVSSPYAVDSLAAELRKVGAALISDIQASENVLADTVAAAGRMDRARVRRRRERPFGRDRLSRPDAGPPPRGLTASGLPPEGVTWARGAIQAPDDGASMSDKSPRQGMTKKTSKSIKEKRADKRAKEHPESLSEQMHSKKK